MKKLLLISLIAMFAIVFNSCKSDSGSTSSNKYDIKSGMLTYKTSMMGMEIKTIQYFKENGDIYDMVTNMEMMGQKMVQHTIRKDGFFYMYSEGQKEGSKTKLDSAMLAAEKDKLDEAAIIKKGGKKVGSEKILDKDCNVYEVTENGVSTKLWIWKNMMLKMVSSQNQMEVTMVATELKETSDFPKGVFELPADINFKESSGATKNFDDPNAKG